MLLQELFRNYIKYPSKTTSKYDNFDPESVLHRLGYKVGKTGLPKSKRRELLKSVIETGELSKNEVINVISRDISMFKNRKNFQYAINDWKDDLDYVTHYL